MFENFLLEFSISSLSLFIDLLPTPYEIPAIIKNKETI